MVPYFFSMSCLLATFPAQDGCGECGGSNCGDRGNGLTADGACPTIKALALAWQSVCPMTTPIHGRNSLAMKAYSAGLARLFEIPPIAAMIGPLLGKTRYRFEADTGAPDSLLCSVPDCCHVSIRASGRFCSQTEAAPCVMDGKCATGCCQEGKAAEASTPLKPPQKHFPQTQ